MNNFLEKPQKENNPAEHTQERQNVSLENYDILRIEIVKKLLDNEGIRNLFLQGKVVGIDVIAFHLDLPEKEIEKLINEINQSLRKIGFEFKRGIAKNIINESIPGYMLKKIDGQNIDEKLIEEIGKIILEEERRQEERQRLERLEKQERQRQRLQQQKPQKPPKPPKETIASKKGKHTIIREFFRKDPHLNEKEVSIDEILEDEILNFYNYLLKKYQNNEFSKEEAIEEIKRNPQIGWTENLIKKRLSILIRNTCLEKFKRGEGVYYRIIPPEQKRRVLKFIYQGEFKLFIFYNSPKPYHNQELSQKEQEIWESIKNIKEPISPWSYFYTTNISGLKSPEESEEIFNSLYEKGYLEKGYILGRSGEIIFYLPRKE
jgi:hypothetical protein